ncbi:MAG: hypothetical protein LBD11_07890 [Candidatus Peribacteria bacterium]|jgi:hypothetical protein|nr:hypothetical protein [Candidatus Peribacteria bacterium]
MSKKHFLSGGTTPQKKNWWDIGRKSFSCSTFRRGSEQPVWSVSPKVFFTKDALDSIQAIVGHADQEVGFLGVVHQGDGIQLPREHFVIEEIHLPKQRASVTNCTLTADGVADYYIELSQTDEGIEKVNAMFFWGHSHHTMGVFASAQDEKQFKEFAEGTDFYIRGIFNKAGDINLSITLKTVSLGILRMDNVPWGVVDASLSEECKSYWEKEIEEKVERVSYYPKGIGFTAYQQPKVFPRGYAYGQDDYVPREEREIVEPVNSTAPKIEEDVDEFERTLESNPDPSPDLITQKDPTSPKKRTLFGLDIGI